MKKTFKTFVIMLMTVLMLTSIMPASASAASKIKLSKTKITLNVKKTYQLKISGTKKKAKWYTSNKKVATVNAKGKVTAKRKGTAKITAKIGSKKYTCKVTVKQPVTSVKLNKKTVTLTKKGATVKLKATAKPANANNRKVSWKSSNTKVAKVNSKGVVTAISNGTAKITVIAKDGSKKKATCTVTVKIKGTANTGATDGNATEPEKHKHKWVAQTAQVWLDTYDVKCGWAWLPELNPDETCNVAERDTKAVREFETWCDQMWRSKRQSPIVKDYLNTHPGCYLPEAHCFYDCVKCRTAKAPESVYRDLSIEGHREHVNEMGADHAAYDNHDMWYVTIIIREKCACGVVKDY